MVITEVRKVKVHYLWLGCCTCHRTPWSRVQRPAWESWCARKHGAWCRGLRDRRSGSPDLPVWRRTVASPGVSQPAQNKGEKNDATIRHEYKKYEQFFHENRFNFWVGSHQNIPYHLPSMQGFSNEYYLSSIQFFLNFWRVKSRCVSK